MTGPRIALLGIHLESNAFAPPATEHDFKRLWYFEGAAMLEEAAKPAPDMPGEISGFLDAMRGRDWTPVPILLTGSGPKGPADHAFFAGVLADMERRLLAAGPLDAAYICNHGAMTTTGSLDPDGEVYAMVRRILGVRPVVASVDLHANISERMVESVDVLVSYITNPHVDMYDRGAESARHLIDLLAGQRAASAFIRLPLTPASVSLLTASGPYADLIAEGQRRQTGQIMNVSSVGGFVCADTPKNGLSIIVTARGDVAPARRLALDLAHQTWDDRQRFVKTLTPLGEAIRLAAEAGADPGRAAVIFSDSVDNPGGGGAGNTVDLLKALHEARVTGAIVGLFIDADLAAEAHRLGVGARFQAVFNRVGEGPHAARFTVDATVGALHDGVCVGRRGLYAARGVHLGPTARLDLGGVSVVVATERRQCADPVFFEMMGLDVGRARTVVVKSRGHFRAGFDEFFPPERVYEVDTPGVTSPVLERIAFKGLPRPVFPLDPETVWRPPAWG